MKAETCHVHVEYVPSAQTLARWNSLGQKLNPQEQHIFFKD